MNYKTVHLRANYMKAKEIFYLLRESPIFMCFLEYLSIIFSIFLNNF